ncbi:PfkB family carbohydrate kinase [Pedobacter gandavensis]|uniref:PfkB family carbohydrate kinase n=1 Tax=Pedobacter TaxID=84567 RepID=UPI001C992EAC|nr:MULTISPECIES: PfkB family carbohydrate kinase [Pedobacter]WGQ10345.1 PfkB family carbohydrate kinase [Pedobacter gandavensis]
MGKVLNFGELLLRISPDLDGNWLKENNLSFYVGGAEANVAAALALWGVPSSYLSAVPDNFMSKQVVNYLNKLNIDTSPMQYTGERIGLYYLPNGKDLKNAGVIYDRNHSSFSSLKTGTIDWDKVLEDVSWLHFSAICPALNEGVVAVCEEALIAASERNIQISLDLNFRSKLWQYGKKPLEVMPALAKYCNLIMGNVWAAEQMLGIPVTPGLAEENRKEAYLEQSKKSAQAIMAAFPKCTAVANTFRFDFKESGVKYYCALHTADEHLVSKEYRAERIIGKIGSGDCFMAGLIYGFYKEHSKEEILGFATRAAFSKLFTHTDFTTTKMEDIPKVAKMYEAAI